MRTRTLAATGLGALALGVVPAVPATALPAAANGVATFKVTTTADTVDTDPGDGSCADAAGACSLRAAVQEANSSGGVILLRPKRAYLLTVAAAEQADSTLAEPGSAGGLLSAAGLDLASEPGSASGAAENPESGDAAVGDLDIAAKVVIRGNGATIDANGIDRVFQVLPGAKLALHQVTVTGGVAAGQMTPANSGGGILNAGRLLVKKSTVAENTAARAGGGIEATPGSRTMIVGSTLSKNTTGATPGNGGALHITAPAGASGTVTIKNSTVAGNTAAREGGGLWNDAGATMTVTNTIVRGNTADGPMADDGGGALFNNGGTLLVSASTINNNKALGAAGSGGGILNLDGDLRVVRSELTGNQSARAGGGIQAVDGHTRLIKTALRNNSTGAAPGNGGGLHLTGAGKVEVKKSKVAGNTAAAQGGGLWNADGGTMTVTDTTVAGNDAPVGANLYQDGDGELTVDGAKVPTGETTR